MENGVNLALDVEVLGDVLALEAERRVTAQMGDVVQAAGQEVVDGDHRDATPEEVVAEVRAKKPGPPRHHHSFQASSVAGHRRRSYRGLRDGRRTRRPRLRSTPRARP